jgi:hypothetical protein
MRYFTLAAILNIVLIAGCTTVTQEQFDVTQKRLVADQALRKKVQISAVSKCTTKMVISKEKVGALAALVNSSPDTLRHDLCNRTIRYYANGKMTYADYRSMVDGHLTAKAVRILQGKL